MTQRHMTWSRVCAALLSLCMLLAVTLPAQTARAADGEEAPVYADGTYQGTAEGYGGIITLSVTIADGQIKEVAEVSQEETDQYWNMAKVLLNTIVEQQTADVDVISGATYSSTGIINAVKNALNQAAMDPNGTFSQGNGSEENPYVIPDAEKLAIFAQMVDSGETYEGKFITLAGDIALSGKWNPIGSEEKDSSAIFRGTFDGGGFTINGLTVQGRYGTEQNVGLFSRLGNTAVVKNLNLDNVDIRVKSSGVIRAGALAGDTEGMSGSPGAKVDSVSARGSVDVSTSGAALAYAGGLLGRGMSSTVLANNWTDVETSSVSTGGSNSAYAGGIAAMTGNDCVVINNAAFGSAYASAPLSTNMGGMAGGIAGMFSGKLWNNYAMGDVVSGNGGVENHTWVGALVGQATVSGMVKDDEGNRQYPEAGPLRAFAYYPSDLTLSVEKQGVTTLVTPIAASGFSTNANLFDGIFTGTELERPDMATAEFADTMDDNLADVGQLLKAYEINGITLRQWAVSDGRVLPTGAVWKVTAPETSIFASGKGTKKNPYLIETADQLRAFAASVTSDNDYNKCYINLAADVDISGSDWASIGGGTAAFNGIFDGKGCTIQGLTMGTQDAPMALEQSPRAGLFGLLGENAVVKNVALTDVFTNVSSKAGVQHGALVGAMSDGAVVDGCSVSGTVQAHCTKGNVFQGGIVGRMDGGVLINSSSNTLVVSENTAAYPEAGGLAGMNNGGLVANCYALGDVQALTGENNSGYTLASLLVGYQGSDVVNCYANGNLITNDKSRFSGMLSGWMRGYARTYNCWYNSASKMTMNGQDVSPVTEIGVPPTAYADSEGQFYIGGLTDGLATYSASDMASLAASMNQSFTAFPVNLSDYGLSEDALNSWTCDSGSNLVVLSGEKAQTTYTRPACEVIPQEEQTMKDGEWFGRDKNKKSVVSVTVKDGKVTKAGVIDGELSGDAYTEAIAKAQEKAVYGDPSTYEPVDPTRFAGGSGTQEDPYLISNEDQLRYIAEAINEDVSWENVYFRQTADIRLTKGDWVPIGWAIMARIKATNTVYAEYPFLGNYDGGDFKIIGLTIGSKNKPSTDPRCALAAGMFGCVSGEEVVGFTPTPSARYVDLRNIHLMDVSIHVDAPFDSYVGALAGDPESGFRAVNCSANGEISTKAKGGIYAGGLMGYPLMGLIQGSWADVNVSAEAGKGDAYAGGLCGMDIRVTTLNSFALGNVYANSESGTTNVGGLSGDFAGIRYNSYASGNVTSGKKTDYIGLLNGQLSGIGGDTNVFYNSDVKLIEAGNELTDKPVNGYSAGARNQSVAYPKNASEITSKAFATLLNENNAKAVDELNAMYEIVKEINHHGHAMYYTGDGSDLPQWAVVNGKVAFQGASVNPGDKPPVQTTSISKASVSGIKAKTYTGKALTQAMTVKVGSTTLKAGTDYTVAYRNNIKVGTATVTITGKGSYTGKITRTFKITAKKITPTVTLSKTSFTYNGKVQKPTVTVKDGKTRLAAANYTVSFSKGLKKVGTYKVTVKLKGNYSGSKTVSYKIVKAANPMTVKGKKPTVKFTALKKKNQTIKSVCTVAKAQGKVTYKKASGNKSITVAKTGSLTVKKGLKKGAYKVKVKVTAAGNANYKAGTKTVTVTVTVK